MENFYWNCICTALAEKIRWASFSSLFLYRILSRIISAYKLKSSFSNQRTYSDFGTSGQKPRGQSIHTEIVPASNKMHLTPLREGRTHQVEGEEWWNGLGIALLDPQTAINGRLEKSQFPEPRDKSHPPFEGAAGKSVKEEERGWIE
ncbi:hypothetical protein AVEN_84514-1 [Araneus ventricosus]|uniref:Uncharacterized protein n=1 Tax=Araneus ventricosus TaxID=182803 RepID=A0A4Y2F943_ARAVE|nr:hypothetical protein AVEN_84514-1 [Araneus ventricosus]